MKINDKPKTLPLFKAGEMVMGFAMHYPVSGKITNLNYNFVEMEWEYFIENDNGYEGKLREKKVLNFNQKLWEKIEEKWNRSLELMNEAAKLQLECKNMLR